MKVAAKWILFAVQPEKSFSTSFMVSARLCGPFSYTLVARVCAFLDP